MSCSLASDHVTCTNQKYGMSHVRYYQHAGYSVNSNLKRCYAYNAMAWKLCQQESKRNTPTGSNESMSWWNYKD